ncbi:conserved hypothetical protein [Trichinella spiralis]|uniref:hypothetical protein n=1 Tax=Trichinella spiralis TaxID=6334 RepID=UPI0001EFBD78|nr:conserved hypothetical protein [Trichinella spiralis]
MADSSTHEKEKNVKSSEGSASESMTLPRSGRRTSLWHVPKNGCLFGFAFNSKINFL